jgi:regulator of cell morphogenesis and NO signaling
MIINEETIGEIVTKDYRKAQAFKKLGIDFCCGGKKTIAEVGAQKGISLQKINEELEAVEHSGNISGELDYDKLPIDFLSDYVINTHHQYCRENIPFITELAQKVARVHGDSHPELTRVKDIFVRVGSDLSQHMMKEENIVFPYVKELISVRKLGGKLTEKPFGNVSNPIKAMDMEHEQAGKDLAEISKITSDYTLPADACNSYTILYKKLEEFENDLHKHVHLESNIIFPKAIKLEKELL